MVRHVILGAPGPNPTVAIDARASQMPKPPQSPDPDHSASAELAEFVQLLTGHQALLRGYIRALIPSASDVGDVLQNTNLALWQRRKEFVPGSNFKAWAFTLARYRALEHRRALRRDRRLVFDDELLDLLAKTAESGLDAERLNRRRHALNHCLKQLKDRDRALLASRYAGGCTLEEYALADGRSPGSLRVILNRLRTLLRPFSSGVRCVLQAPADVTLGSEDLLRVGTGQAWFHVPQPAAGFRVETAGILVTDLGTEFGVVSRADGRDEVHVFRGKVAIEARTGKRANEMLAGGAARVVSDSGSFAEIEPRPGRFLATLPTKLPLHLHWAFDESDAGRRRVASNHARPIASECVPLGSDRMSACFSVVPGKFGNALSSLGRDGCVETDWPGIEAGKPFTLAYWIKMPPGQSSVESVVAWGAPGPGAEPPVSPFLSSVLDTGDGCVPQAVLGGQGFQGNTRLDDGQWHHLAMVATGRSDGTGTPDFSCYVDGQPEPMSRLHAAPRHPAPPRDADGRSGTGAPPFSPLTLLNHATSQEVLHQDVNLALVREQGTTTAYLNGVPIGSTGRSSPSLGALTTLTIGANRHTSGRLEGFFTGSVDRVRLSTFRGSLASTGLLGAGSPQREVLADYTFDDHRTPPGFVEVGDPGYAGGRLVLDGDDAIELVPTPLTATDNFVIEARVRMTGLPANERKFAFPLSNSNGANEGWGLLYQQTWGGIVMSVCAVGSGSASNGHPVALAVDELHIFEAALTRDQIPNLIRHNAMSPPAR